MAADVAIVVETKRKLDEAIREVNRLGKSLAGAASEFLKKDAGQLAVADPRLIAEAATDLITAHAGLIQAQHNYDYARRQA